MESLSQLRRCSVSMHASCNEGLQSPQQSLVQRRLPQLKRCLHSRQQRWQVSRAEKKDSGTKDPSLAQQAQQAVQNTVQNVKEAFDVIDDNVLDYCNLDPASGGRPKSRVSLGEKEQIFLDALRSFYFDDKPMMNNDEFDNLKEELLWEGSKVAILSVTEQKFMQASMAAAAGNPIMSDEDYDALKSELVAKNSAVVRQGPRCSLRSGNMYSNASPAYLKMTALNIPAAVGVLAALYVVDDLTGFTITNLVELPEPWGIVFLWGLVLPTLFVFVASITNVIFKDNLILRGQCPNCGATNSTYFGDILTVAGNRDRNEMDCVNCKGKLTFIAPRREIKMSAMPGDNKKKGKEGAKAKGNADSGRQKGSDDRKGSDREKEKQSA